MQRGTLWEPLTDGVGTVVGASTSLVEVNVGAWSVAPPSPIPPILTHPAPFRSGGPLSIVIPTAAAQTAMDSLQVPVL